jgi:hypothetical protein
VRRGFEAQPLGTAGDLGSAALDDEGDARPHQNAFPR